MGFVFLCLSLGSVQGLVCGIFYLVIYILITLNFFLILLLFTKNNFNPDIYIRNINELCSLFNSNSILTIFFIIIVLFSMSGLPPFGFFLSKYYLLNALILDSQYFLSLFVILMSIISSAYYLR